MEKLILQHLKETQLAKLRDRLQFIADSYQQGRNMLKDASKEVSDSSPSQDAVQAAHHEFLRELYSASIEGSNEEKNRVFDQFRKASVDLVFEFKDKMY